MRIEIIKQRERKTEYYFRKEWNWKGMPGAGYGFPCDEHGNVDVDSLPDAGRANYEDVQHNDKLVYVGVRRYVRSWVEDAVGRCHCGAKVQLSDPLTNVCSCGRAYNMSGQEVDPNPNNWDEPYEPEPGVGREAYFDDYAMRGDDDPLWG